jgi:glycosyltransferase involved in cell wall biosynthesis
MMTLDRKLNILHIILSAGETNCQYHEHCLPVKHQRNITICTYFQKKDPSPDEITVFNGDNSLFGFFRALNSALQAQKYDVIHVHAPMTGFLFLLATFLSGWYGKAKLHTVYTVHNSYQNFTRKNQLLMMPIFAGFQELIFCSHACLESFPDSWRQRYGHKMHVVQNAVNLDRIEKTISEIDPNRRSDLFTITSVGRLITIKNPLTLLNAFQQADDGKSQLISIGDGNLKLLLAQEIENMGLQASVKMTGLISRDEVFQYSAQSDLFVSTSRGEGLPVAVLEVMAAGCPVILSDIPPHREIAETVNFIPLIAPDNVEGFAREIKRFQEMSHEQRRVIGEQCRRLVREKFSLTSMHQGYQQVYDRIIENSQDGSERIIASI